MVNSGIELLQAARNELIDRMDILENQRKCIDALQLAMRAFLSDQSIYSKAVRLERIVAEEIVANVERIHELSDISRRLQERKKP